MGKRRKRKTAKILITAVLVLVLVLAAGGAAGVHYYNKHQDKKAEEAMQESYRLEVEAMQGEYRKWKEAVDTDTIYSGISAMGVDLGGMTLDQAKEALEDFYDGAVLQKQILLTYKDQSWKYTYADLGFTANTDEIAQEAYDTLRSGDIKARYEAIRQLQEEPVDLVLTDQYEDTAIDTILEEIASEVDVEAKNAKLTREDGAFKLTKETVGYTLDMETTKAALQEKLTSNENIELELTVEEKQPHRTIEMLSKVKEVIGSFSTSYSLNNTGRNRNLEVGCARVSGTVLMPGDSFNFNDTVSPVDTASGYMESSTIVDGEYVPGLGGGLCQVCTTLYNAVIRAELEVTERYAHSLEPGYVPNGQDAAMSIGGKNFQFVNSSEYPIYITMSAYNGTLSCTIYGVEEHDPSRKVSFESVKTGTLDKPDPVITEDDTMEEGQEEVTSYGKEGSKYDVYKIVTENGETTRTYFNSSTYYPTADKITRGTKKVGTSSDSSGEEDPEE